MTAPLKRLTRVAAALLLGVIVCAPLPAVARARSQQLVGQFLRWASSDSTVVLVSQRGLAVVTGLGSATITATASNGLSGSARLTVGDTLPDLDSVAVFPKGRIVSPGMSWQFTAVAYWSDGTTTIYGPVDSIAPASRPYAVAHRRTP